MDIAVARPTHTDLARRALGAGCAIIAGSLLFLAGRKLAWGRDQSFADWPMWAIAAAPYIGYFAALWSPALRFSKSARRITESTPRSAEPASLLQAFLKESDFLWIWTMSLAAFVVMRTSAISRLYEAGIYDATVVGIVRYTTISAVYVCFGFLAVTAWRLIFGRQADVPRLIRTSLIARATGLILAFVLFYIGIFLIEP